MIMHIFLHPRMITLTATDTDGVQSQQARINVLFDRTCTQWPSSTVFVPSAVPLSQLSICTGMPQLKLSISGDAITSLTPLQELTVIPDNVFSSIYLSVFHFIHSRSQY